MMASDDQSNDAKPEGGGSQDVALIHGVNAEGDLQILRKRENRLELGAVRALREGAPIHGEVVRLTPRKGFPLLCDVETTFQPPAPPPPPTGDTAGLRKGPAQVATEEYRRNWDLIWDQRAGRDLSN